MTIEMILIETTTIETIIATEMIILEANNKKHAHTTTATETIMAEIMVILTYTETILLEVMSVE